MRPASRSRLVALCALFALVGGCGGPIERAADDDVPDRLAYAATRSATLRVAAVDFPGTHPFFVHPGRVVGGFGADLLYEGLTQRDDESGRITGDLAESWTVSDDRLEWRFRIADGHTFSDGSEVNAAAVASSLQRVLADRTSAAGSLLDMVREVDRAGDVVIMRTADPNMELPAVLAAPCLGVIKGQDDAPLGSGDWIVQSEDRYSVVLLPRPSGGASGGSATGEPASDTTASPASGGTIGVDGTDRSSTTASGARRPGVGSRQAPNRIEFRLADDYDTVAKWLADGDVDIAPVDPASRPDGSDVVRAGAPVLVYLGVNAGTSGWSDPGLRGVLSRSLDRDAVAAALGVVAQPTDAPGVADELGVDACGPCRGDAAAGAGLGPAVGEVTVDVVDEMPFGAAAAAVVEQLTAMGVTATERRSSAADFGQRVSTGDFSVAVWATTVEPGAPLDTARRVFASGADRNVGGVANVDLDAAMADALAGTTSGRAEPGLDSAWGASTPAVPLALMWPGFRVGRRVVGGVEDGFLRLSDVRVIADSRTPE